MLPWHVTQPEDLSSIHHGSCKGPSTEDKDKTTLEMPNKKLQMAENWFGSRLTDMEHLFYFPDVGFLKPSTVVTLADSQHGDWEGWHWGVKSRYRL